jgi:TctA family transporter
MIFFERPISAGFMVATGVLLLLFIAPAFRKKRRQIIVED